MKKKVLKRVCSTAMGALMFVCLPLSTFAATTIDVSESDRFMIALSDYDEDVILTGTNAQVGIFIEADPNADKVVVLRDLNIGPDGNSQNYPIFLVMNSGNVSLELDGTNIIKSDHWAGVTINETIVTIKDDNGTPGSLEAKGGTMSAGIGGVAMDGAVNVIIDGGTVTATGGFGGAGIGGGHNRPATVTINDGTVTAIGGEGGAGIGGGGASDGTVTINGGEVTAIGGEAGAGIGGGGASDGTVTINGGDVTAIGGEGGAGLGGGIKSSGSTVTISNDATVYAVGGGNSHGLGEGAAIGEGGNVDDDDNPVNGEDVAPDISNLYTTGSVTTFAVGTTVEQIKAGSEECEILIGSKADPNKVKEPETPDDETKKETPGKEQPPVYTERSYIADVNVAALIATALKADPNAKEVNIEFGDNICLTPDIMKDLFADNRVAKNCMFSHKGKRYVLRINAVDTKSKAYADGFAALKEEPDGLAGFLQMAKLFEALGVKATELDQ